MGEILEIIMKVIWKLFRSYYETISETSINRALILVIFHYFVWVDFM